MDTGNGFWGLQLVVFFESDARSACRGATCRTARSDFRVPRKAMVGVGFGM